MNINHIKIAFAALLGFLSSLLGVLALPVFLVVSC
ncbi:holin, partial [Lachnospiraceae bacterium]|nr:holin [Lachnospiraceae bacterium]